MSIKRPEGGWNITRTPVHPGEMLREEFMKPLGISINGLALELHVPVTRVSEIVNERRGIRIGVGAAREQITSAARKLLSPSGCPHYNESCPKLL